MRSARLRRDMRTITNYNATMRFSGNAIVAVCLGACGGAAATVPQTAETDPKQPSHVQEIVKRHASKLMSSEGVPLKSLVLAATSKGEQHVGGFGSVGNGGVPDGDTLYRVASVTKPLSALLLFSYLEDESIDESDSVVNCAEQELAAFCGHTQPTSWIDLTTHYSGLPTAPADPNFDPNTYFASHAAKDPPGQSFNYSTVGYAALAWTLEQRTGESYEQLLMERIITPLNMASTRFNLSTEMQARVAVGHRDGAPIADQQRPRPLWASGALFSTGNDLLRFLSANLDPSTAPTLKSTLSVAQVVLPERSTFPPSVAAKGWQYFAPLKVYWHSGTAAGYSAFVGFHREKQASVVLLTNTGIGGQDTRLAMAGFAVLAEL